MSGRRTLAPPDPVAARPDALVAVLDALVGAIGGLAAALEGATPAEAHLRAVREAATPVEAALARLTDPVCIAEWAVLVREAYRGGASLLEPVPAAGEAARAVRFHLHLDALEARLDAASAALDPLPERWDRLLLSPSLLRMASAPLPPTPDALLASLAHPQDDPDAAERSQAWTPLSDLRRAQRHLGEMGKNVRAVGQVFARIAQRGATDA